jgi:hypothetical protein
MPNVPARHWILSYAGGLGFGMIVWKLTGSGLFGIPAIFVFIAAYVFLVGRYIVKAPEAGAISLGPTPRQRAKLEKPAPPSPPPAARNPPAS